jgi:hypothetical protein
MSASPPFVLLVQKLPADTLALKLIGRIVEDVRQPTNGYRPEDPRPLLDTTPIEVTDTDASVYQNSIKNTTVKAQLGQLFGVAAQGSKTDGTQLSGKTIVTRLLPQHRDAYDAIYAAHGRDIEKLLKLNGGVGYMIVGLKTILDGSVDFSRSHEQGLSGETSAPVGAVLAATTQGVGAFLGNSVDPSIGGGKVVAAEWAARHQMMGERVFAIQYRVVSLEKQGKLWNGKKTARLKSMYVVNLQDGVYGDNHDDKPKEVVYEDDESETSGGEEEEEGEDSLEGWTPTLLEKALTDGEFQGLGLNFIDS